MAISVGWMLGVTPPGIVAVGPNVEIRIDIDATLELRRAIVEAIASGVSIDCLADIADATLGETQELVKLLQSNGAISDLPPAALPKGIALAAALREFGAGKVPSGMIWTAEEVLVIPQSLAAHDRSRVIRAFVAGLRPEGRLHAYSLVLAGDGLVCGDHPDAAAVAERVSRVTLGPGEVAALDLVFGDVFKVQAQQIDQIGAYGAHRLGPIVEIGIPQSLDLSNEGLALFVAEIAVANIDVPTPAIARRVQGFGEPDEARLIARAEAVERYAAADLRKAELIRAAIDELKGALNPREIYVLSRRQDTVVHLNEPGLWCLAETSGGSRRWVPAEAVYTSLIDSMRSQPARALDAGRELLQLRHARGRLIAVVSVLELFGQAHAMAMGAAARVRADHLILTTQRWLPGERGDRVTPGLREGAESVTGASLEIVPDRRSAIAAAIECADVGDVLMVLGRGNVAGDLYGRDDRPAPFDDRQVVRQLVAQRR